MKTTWTLLVLTLVNLGLLAYQLGSIAAANSAAAAPILRGSGIEIVDSEGRLRAQLKLEAANASFKMPDGKIGYPETVIFRLIIPEGKPRVKLTTSEEGSGLMLLGDSDTTHTILKAGAAETSLLLRNSEATQRVLPLSGRLTDRDQPGQPLALSAATGAKRARRRGLASR